MKRTMFLAAALVLTASAPAQADPTRDGLKTFKEYLEKTHPGKKWGTGPARLDSKEIQRAYPNVQFYYVFSSPPLPPGAFLPELIERHRRASEDFTKNYISVTAAIGPDGVKPLSNKVADLSRGLMLVKSEDDAKLAAAAALSLCPEGGHSVAPTVLTPTLVKVTRTDKGWQCSAKQRFLHGTVTFDADGKLIAVQRQSMLPLPPSAPPRRPIDGPRPR